MLKNTKPPKVRREGLLGHRLIASHLSNDIFGPIQIPLLLLRLASAGQVNEVREKFQVVLKRSHAANSGESVVVRHIQIQCQDINFSANCVEAAEPGNLAVWASYAVIVKIVSGLESRI